MTRHAARALGRQASHGQLAPGFVANFAIWDAEHPVEMVYEPWRSPLWAACGTRRTAMMLWQATPANLWQGRDDSAEASNALRLFQTIAHAERFAPQEMPGDIALLGFACDEGVRRNKGRTGAADGPATLRRALANMASHQGHDRCVDMGTISVDGEQLEAAHQALREAVADCQRAGNARWSWAAATRRPSHGAGVLDAFPGEKWALLISMRIWICALPTAPAPGRRSASWRWSVTRSSAVFTIPASGLAGRRTPRRYGMKRRAARWLSLKIWRC